MVHPAPVSPGEKLLERAAFAAACRQLRAAGATVVFTNGCFDLVHRGHVEYLREAAALGDALFVGVNDDASVRLLKGPGRPLLPAPDRLALLAEFHCVTRLCLFAEASVLRLVAEVRPDVLVKGGDYALEDVVGRDLVQGYGGTVRTVSFWPGLSSSDLIRRIRALPP